MARNPAEIVPLMLRLREDLRRRVERQAKRNNRSMNAEIVARLEHSLGRLVGPALEADRLVIEEAVNATIDRPIDAAIARGASFDALKSFPMFSDWATRHPEHPMAIRHEDELEQWIPGIKRIRQESIERERIKREGGSAPQHRAAKRRSSEES